MKNVRKITTVLLVIMTGKLMASDDKPTGDDWLVARPGAEKSVVLERVKDRIIGRYPDAVVVQGRVSSHPTRMLVGFSGEKVVSIICDFDNTSKSPNDALKLFNTLRENLPKAPCPVVAIKIDGIIIVGEQFRFNGQQSCQIVCGVEESEWIYHLYLASDKSADIGVNGTVTLEVSRKTKLIVD